MVEKVVYFLGAGFSAPLGLPVMDNFYQMSKDIYFDDRKRYAHFTHVFETVKAISVTKNYFQTDLFNIEEILSILEMRARLRGDKSSGVFLRYIADVISHCTPEWKPHREGFGNRPSCFFHPVSTSPANPYGDFVASLQNLQASPDTHPAIGHTVRWTKVENPTVINDVITVNYDMVLEDICRFINENYTASPEIQFDRLEEDTHDDQRVNPRVMKLHGSVDSGEMVPPTWSKDVSEQMTRRWSAARSALAEANHIRILGYSLPVADANVRYLFKSALVDSQHLKTFDVITIDRDRTTKARYDEFVTFKYYRFANQDLVRYLRELQSENRRASGAKGERLLFSNREKAHHLFMDRFS